MRFWIGTSSFYCKDYVGPFYPAGMQKKDFLKEYAKHFDSVEIDSTFYRIPSKHILNGWNNATPPHFRFSLKMFRGITHELFLTGAPFDQSVKVFGENLTALGKKLGVLLVQFPYFNRKVLPEQGFFFERLEELLSVMPREWDVAVEVRNKTIWNQKFLNLLKHRNVLPVLIDHPWMFAPSEYARRLEPLQLPKLYVRFLGDRHKIEADGRKLVESGQKERLWDERFFLRERRLREWAEILLKNFMSASEIYIFANRHFEGYAPGTAELFREIVSHLEKKHEDKV